MKKLLLAASLALLLTSAVQAHPHTVKQATITGCGQVSQAAQFSPADEALPWLCYIDTQGRQLTEFIIWAVFTRHTPEAQIQVQWVEEGEIADVSIALPQGNRYITLIRNED